ncbi:MAG: hypothetical protein ACLT46_14295 [Hungatella sp.]
MAAVPDSYNLMLHTAPLMKLSFNRWYENPDYREETVVRQYPTGKILEIMPGSLWELPDGQHWGLK